MYFQSQAIFIYLYVYNSEHHLNFTSSITVMKINKIFKIIYWQYIL